MQKSYFQDKNFSLINFAEQIIKPGEYDGCKFEACIFSGIDLSGFEFEDCIFSNCDFSNTKISGVAFKNVQFEHCKLIGLQFDECNPFLLEFHFNVCILNYSSFYQLKIIKTIFTKCILQEVDFTETNLSEANFTECDFSGAMFNATNLRKADLRTSYNFSINPEQNQISGAKFSLETLPGLLHQYNIEIG